MYFLCCIFLSIFLGKLVKNGKKGFKQDFLLKFAFERIDKNYLVYKFAFPRIIQKKKKISDFFFSNFEKIYLKFV